MAEIHKKMLDDFHSRLTNDFTQYFESYSKGEEKVSEFITFLIDHSLIDKHTIRRYTVLREFKALFDGGKNKTTLVGELARKYNISERSVWSVLKGYEGEYYRNSVTKK